MIENQSGSEAPRACARGFSNKKIAGGNFRSSMMFILSHTMKYYNQPLFIRALKGAVFWPRKYKFLFISVSILIALGAVIYFNSLNGDFILDDSALVRDNSYIKDWRKSANLFTEEIGSGSSAKLNFYRPFQMVTYAMDYAVWRLDVRGYHLTNISLHILVALAIYWFINILFGRAWLSFLTALLFLAHPIHTEAVAYISSRADMLSALFVLICLIFYIKQIPSKSLKGLILVLSSYVLALFSKENSLIVPILLAFYAYTFRKKIRLDMFIYILTVTFIYIILRFTALRFIFSGSLPHAGLMERIPGFFVAISEYLRLLLMPVNLHMEYGSKLFSFNHPKAILGILIILALLTCVLMKRNNNRLVFFSIGWFLITLLPVSNLYPLNAFMAEHWLYLPSLGFFLILADSLIFLYKKINLRLMVAGSAVCLVFFYSYLTVKQNNYWKNKITFYNRTLRFVTDSPRIYSNLCKAYVDIGKSDEAVTFCNKAIALKPDFSAAYHNLGNAYMNKGNHREAISSYLKAIEFNPKNDRIYNSLGCVYLSLGQTEEGIAQFRKALEINPGFSDTYYNLGNAYAGKNKVKEAIIFYEKAIQTDPNNIHAPAYYNNLAAMYALQADISKAGLLYKKALKIEPGYKEARENLNRLKQAGY